MEEQNPFEAPVADPTPEFSAHDEAVRRAHLDHETAVLGIGTVWIVVAVFNGLLALSTLGAARDLGGLAALSIGVLFAGLCGLCGWIGTGLRQLDRRARVPAMIVAGLGLLSFPIGTLVGVYVLYRLGSDGGSFVLSTEYQAIRQRTPHIRHRNSPALLPALLILLGLLLVIGVVVAAWR